MKLHIQRMPKYRHRATLRTVRTMVALPGRDVLCEGPFAK
jgi:hypothetical protein